MDFLIVSQKLLEMSKIHIEILFLDERLHSALNVIGYFINWGFTTVLMNDELNTNFLIFLEVALDSSAGFIEQFGGIDDINLAFSNLGNNVNYELCFGIHNNHPLRSPNIQRITD